MIDMKCPFCGEKLQQTYSFNLKQFWCSNYYDHKHPINLQGTKELWQALIDSMKEYDLCHDALVERTKELNRTRKALDKAKWWLKKIVESHRCTPISTAEMALAEITALEKSELENLEMLVNNVFK